MGECERSSKRTTRVGKEAEAMEMENSSSSSSVSKRTRLIGAGFGGSELPDSGDELQETASSSPAALPPAAEDEEEVVTLNSGPAVGVSTLEESSSRFCSSNESGEVLDLEEASSFETDGSTSCVANNNLSRETRITESRQLSSNSPSEEMESEPDGEEKRLARARYEPPPSPAPRRVRTQKPSPPAPSSKVLRLSPAQLETLFGAFERDQCKAFKEKYNFDFVNEVPLEGGRYEWVQLKPEEGGVRE